MWTVIYMATDKETALRVVEAIKSEGFLVRTRQTMKSKRHGCCIEIVVPESEAQDASRVIFEKNL